MDESVVNKLKLLLEGSVCTGMDNLGGYLQIFFSHCQLIVGSAWRLIQNGEIVMGSASEESVLEKMPNILVGQRVLSVLTHGHFNDLRVEFQKGIVLEVFANSEKYEHWNVVGESDEMIIAGPGHLWSSF